MICLINKRREAEVQKNQEHIYRLLKTTIYLGRQNMNRKVLIIKEIFEIIRFVLPDNENLK